MNGCFKIYGPFEIRDKRNVTDKDFQKQFWSECDEKDDGCRRALCWDSV